MRLILRISIIVFLLLSLITIFLLYDRSPSEGYSGNLENGLPHGFGTWNYGNHCNTVYQVIRYRPEKHAQKRVLLM